jgi:protein-S-isoprenylcysteine O-methyltransferase Ste14
MRRIGGRFGSEGLSMKKEKDGAGVLFFPPGIPLITIGLGVILQWVRPITFGFTPGSPVRYFIGGGLAVGAILVLGLWSVILFRKGGQSENPWKPTLHIEERGPYRFTRNPMYLQMLIICIGVAIACANYWILLLTPFAGWAFQRLAIRPEEIYLEQKFGETYLQYKKRVRRWL